MGLILLPTVKRLVDVDSLSTHGTIYYGGEHRFADAQTLELQLSATLESGTTGGLHVWCQGYSGEDWYDLPVWHRLATSSTTTAGAIAQWTRNIAQGVIATARVVTEMPLFPSTPIRIAYGSTTDRVFSFSVTAVGKKL